MATKEVIDKLATLTEREREVLQLRCKGQKYAVVASQMQPKVDVGTIKSHMNHIYIKLGLDQLPQSQRWHTLFQEYCPALAVEPLPIPEKPTARSLVPVSSAIIKLVEEDEGLVPIHPPGSLFVIDQFSSAKHLGQPRGLLLLFAGLSLGVLISIGLFLILGGVSAPKEVITVVTAPPKPTNTLSVIVVTASPQPVTATFQFTDTPKPPTNTPVPTVTPTPTVKLPFSDNFNQGLRPEWRIYGDYLIVGGQLTTNDVTNSLSLEVGDESWSNYSVGFDVSRCVNFASVEIIYARKLKYATEADMYSGWSAFTSDNNWTRILSGSSIYCYSEVPGRMSFSVSGNTYTLRFNGKTVSEITYGQPLKGPLGLTIKRRAYIDNVTITSP